MKTLMLLLALTACGREHKQFANDPEPCTTQETEDGATISCPDGSGSSVKNGRDGAQGVQGKPGALGQTGQTGPRGDVGPAGERGAEGTAGPTGQDAVLEVIDPCSDGPGPDEVLLRLDTGQVEAWYQDVGNYILQPGLTYVTSDNQACQFTLDENGEVTW